MNMNYAIVDDETEARDLIRGLVERNYPDFQLMGETDNVADTCVLLENDELDLVFLDIQLYDRNIFEISEQLCVTSASIVFITAYDHFALNAFKVHALAYLLKPVISVEFKSTVDELLRRKTVGMVEQQKQAIRELGQLKERKILIHNQEGISVVPLDQIVRLEADNNYSTFHLADHKKIVSAKTLKDYDLILQSFGFVRSHQSHLVNLHHIVKYSNRDGGRLIMSDQSIVPVSQRKRMDVLDQLSGKMI